MTVLVVLVIIAIVVIVAFIGLYNQLIRLIEAVNNNKRQIDIQLDRRYKVFESLINVVKKYMDYEKSTLKEVVALRNQAQQAAQTGDEKTRMQAENGISKIASGINVVFEQYPDLKANQNAMQLQEEIVSTENKLAFAKQSYNDSVERYMATKKSLIQSFIVTMAPSQLNKNFEYWALPEETIKSQEAYKVQL